MSHRTAHIVLGASALLTIASFGLVSPDAGAATHIPLSISSPSGRIAAVVPAETQTVEDALLRLGIDSRSVIVSPPPSATVLPNMLITLTPTRTFTLIDGVKLPESIVSAARTVGDALVTTGAALGPLDRVSPEPSAALSDGMSVTITRIEEVERTETVDIPHPIIALDDAAMLWGDEVLLSAGQNGSAEEDVLVRFVNGEVARRTVLARRVLKEPVAEEVRRGIKIVIEAVEEGGGSWYAYKDCDCAAHNRYPRGTWLRVTNLLNDKQVIVKTNDWGPDPSVHPDRVVDLDAVAFKKLYPLWKGVIPVRVEKLLTND